MRAARKERSPTRAVTYGCEALGRKRDHIRLLHKAGYFLDVAFQARKLNIFLNAKSISCLPSLHRN